MKDLLFEIGCEEIPASYIEPALAWLKDAAQKEITASRISYGEVSVFGTPRRLVLVVRQVSDAQADLTQEILGPRAEMAFDASGSLTPQAKGFLSAKKIDFDKAYRKSTPKGDVLAAHIFEPGQSALAVLPLVLQKLISEMPFPKTMRWEPTGATFARPVRWIVALLGSEVVPVIFAGVQSGSQTTGHRFHAPGFVPINNVENYLKLMQSKSVMLRPEERRALIKSGSENLAKEQGGEIVQDEGLLDTVKNLVEYPWPLVGEFEDRYLEIPREILICEMREHQKYFSVQNVNGKLLSRFVVVAGSNSDDPKATAAGHARVLRARFEDGAFYYYEDLKTPLADMQAKLDRVQFQRELGSVLEKSQRIEALGAHLAAQIGAKVETATRAAQLCKADLVSGVVAQFPELQGVMGGYYAAHAGESADVALAVREHYSPRFAGDAIPSTDVGCVVSLADKVDTLVGVIGIGKAPKGNADPFALRRAAIAVARIIIEKGYRLSLREIVQKSIEIYGAKLKAAQVEEIVGFILGRARGVFSAPTTILDGAIDAGSDDLADLSARIQALTYVQQKDSATFEQLAAALKRAGNIVAKAVADKAFDANSSADMSGLQHASEKELSSQIQNMQKTLGTVSNSKTADELQRRYIEVMSEIAALKPFVDRFFDDVMVMVDDVKLRNARLALLNQLQSAARVVADFTRVQF